MPFIENLGMQAAQGAMGAGMGLILGGIDRKAQLKQQQKLQNMQIAGQMEMGKFNQGLALEMWDKTNYKAQVDQLKKAGLNPGLLYGHGGPGGTLANTPGQVTAGQAAPQGPAAGMGMQMGTMQLQLLDAQKRNIEADTANKQAENPNIPKAGKLMDLDAELKDIDIVIKSIDETIKGKTQNAAIAEIMQRTEEGMQRLEIARNQAEISDKTMLATINQKIAEAAGAAIENSLKASNIAKNQEEINRIKQDVTNMIQENLNRKQQIAIDQQLANFETSFGKQVGGIIGNILGLIPGLGGKKSTITHKGGQQNTTIHKRQ